MPCRRGFSLPYLLASALVDGRLALDAFTADALVRPGVRTLIPKVHMRPDPAQSGDGNVDRVPLRATGHGAGSRRAKRGRERCRSRGVMRVVRSAAMALHAKFVDCASRALPPAAHDAAFEALDGLAQARGLEAIADRLGASHGGA